jgi:hypothetical protein
VRRFLVTTNVVPSSPIVVTLMMEALRLSETSVLKRAIRRDIPEYDILQRYIMIVSVIICLDDCSKLQFRTQVLRL